MAQSKQDQQIGYILRSYPRFSQTFVLNEILNLETIGVPLQIFAMVHPREAAVQPEVAQVRAAVHYLSGQEAGLDSSFPHGRAAARFGARYFGALFAVLRSADIDRAYSASSRWACFEQAVRLALWMEEQKDRGEPGIGHLHAHFAHDPTLVAQLVHRLTGVSFSFTAHARDLYQVNRDSLRGRICEASAVLTCCRSNLNYLRQVAPDSEGKFSLIYHGVNVRYFRPAEPPATAPEIPLILSVGRLVEKKGFFDLLAALAQVKAAGRRFRCEIYGDGPLRGALEQAIASQGLAGCVFLMGSLPQQELARIYQTAALFALTPHIADDGDQDGIPNVLAEAMAAGIPVVSTTVAGIPELIQSPHNGLLRAPHDTVAIAEAVGSLLDNPARRARLGQAARRKVTEQFDVHQASIQLQRLFYGVMEGAPEPSANLFGRPACA